MKKTENRPVEVGYCDFCKKESAFLSKCAICGREMCSEEGGAKHAAFAIEIYKYGRGERIKASICKECSGKTLPVKLSVGEILNMLLGKEIIISM